jgi:hypothetical protein
MRKYLIDFPPSFPIDPVGGYLKVNQLDLFKSRKSCQKFVKTMVMK